MTLPNIVLILTDNQNAGTLGCYGNTEISTPHLDRMAGSGLQMDKAFCPNAFCSPCRASLLTGQLPSGHGVHSWLDDRRVPPWPPGWHALPAAGTLPVQLQQLGYRTGLFGKYHLGDASSPAPGWDRWLTMADGHVRSFYDNAICDDGAAYTHPGHAVDFFTDHAIAFLQQDRPTFTYLSLPAPYGHWPATQDPRPNAFTDQYAECPMHSVPRQGLSAEAVAKYDAVKASSGGGLDFSMLLRAPGDLPTLRNYYSQISLIDAAIGRLLQAAPDTLVVFTADHGLSLGHHGFWGHGGATIPSNMHWAAHSIPMLLYHDGHIQPGRSDLHVSNMDLFATLLDYAGAPPQDALPSRSFAPLMRSAPLTAWGPDCIIAEQEETRVLRSPDWLYFQRFKGRAPFADALYDLRRDPAETQNLALDPAYTNVIHQLSAQIDRHMASHSRPQADLWRGGQPLQNSIMQPYWRAEWGDAWAPVYDYVGTG